MHSQKIPKNRWKFLSFLVINLSLAISYIGLWFIQAKSGNLWRADFSAFYTGWAIVRDGQGSQIYDFELEKHYQQDILGTRSFAEGLLPFNNPPHVALIFAPLAYLSLQNAFMVWTLIQVGLLLWMLWLLYRLAHDWSSSQRAMLLITAAALPSMLINFMLGAFSLLMLVCILQIVQSLRRNQPVNVGLWFLIGTIKPQALILLGIVLLAGRRWRELLITGAGGLVAFIASSFALGWNTWPDYIQQLRTTSNFFGIYGIDPRNMYNFRGTLALILGKDNATLINNLSILALIATIIFLFWLWRGSWQVKSPGFSLRMALTLILGSFFNLHANPQDGLLLIAPAALFFDYLYRRGLPLRAYAAFLLLCPVFFLVSEFTIGGNLGVRGPVLAMMVLIVWIAIYLSAGNIDTLIKINDHDAKHG